MLWTHAGLRKNEIARLILGCAQAPTQAVVEDNGTDFTRGRPVLLAGTREQDL
ncbi:hypothetical protein [Pseudomonas sp. FP1740]|uniref:hypothetical protein n=1 Tax=Pseudomonas sp. FP1740 TaxID=2954078 RepID=UPI00351ECCFE